MKPVVFFIDDEPRNLTVFECTVPETWEVHTYDNAIDALKAIKEKKPWLIVSDQKMPNMTGLEFLEVASQISPEAVRVVVTGQTEEETLVQLIRRAKIFDFITKPWQPESFLSRLEKGIEYYRINQERRLAFEEVSKKNQELESKNLEMAGLMDQLQKASEREKTLRSEISAWAPAPIVAGIESKKLNFPAKRDIVGITYDIIESAETASQLVGRQTVRAHIVRRFTESLLKFGGLPESWSGDSMYGHFGAVDSTNCPFKAALAAAQQFRVSLRSFSEQNQVTAECGIAIHFVQNALIQVDEIKVQTDHGEICHKTFHTESKEIDLLHRIEKLVHNLPGSNIIMTEDYVKKLDNPPPNLADLGLIQNDRMTRAVRLYLIPSYFAKTDILEEFKAKYQATQNDLRKAA